MVCYILIFIVAICEVAGSPGASICSVLSVEWCGCRSGIYQVPAVLSCLVSLPQGPLHSIFGKVWVDKPAIERGKREWCSAVDCVPVVCPVDVVPVVSSVGHNGQSCWSQMLTLGLQSTQLQAKYSKQSVNASPTWNNEKYHCKEMQSMSESVFVTVYYYFIFHFHFILEK